VIVINLHFHSEIYWFWRTFYFLSLLPYCYKYFWNKEVHCCCMGSVATCKPA